MNPLTFTGVAVGGLAFAERFGIAADPTQAAPTPGGTTTPTPTETHVTTGDYTTLVAWARSTYGYRGGNLEAFLDEDRRQGIAVWGGCASDETTPAWEIASCIRVLNRWAAIGERFEILDSPLMPDGNRNGEVPGAQAARCRASLDALRHVRNQLLSDPDANASAGDGRVDENVCKETWRRIAGLGGDIAAEGDFTTLDPRYDWGYLDYAGDRAEVVLGAVGDAAGTVGSKLGELVGSLGLGVLKGVFTTPLGAAVLLVGGYLVYRKVAS